MITDIKYWLEISEYDLGTAKAMLAARRYLYVLFTCQQAMEKLLKAIIIQNTKEFPPRLHNLLRLAEISNLALLDKEKAFLERLSYYYVETRYPEKRRQLAKDLNRQTANEDYGETQNIWKRLKKEIS
ncbi:HEPN domain-containing protein [Candidatus Saganbacteria bacterium]|nr:HEPN domain-containing protein [Candidatus Saganbacteria bacterium]